MSIRFGRLQGCQNGPIRTLNPLDVPPKKLFSHPFKPTLDDSKVHVNDPEVIRSGVLNGTEQGYKELVTGRINGQSHLTVLSWL